MYFIGIDIGGTKCAVNVGEVFDEGVKIKYKCTPIKTNTLNPYDMLDTLLADVNNCIKIAGNKNEIGGIGISCGGPLNSANGIILSPPNLPKWDRIEITHYFQKHTHLKTWLCNDANACALAEWKMGAGKGCSNLIFLTFGTGLGAGLILDNKLYTGANDMAGEVGHIKLQNFGPCGYGKIGSFEAFCSGGGIKQLAQTVILSKLQSGEKPQLCPDISGIQEISAETVGKAAKNGDKTALEILKISGENLGLGLSILIDILNPHRIVIGSIFERCYEQIWPYAQNIIEQEALKLTRDNCIVLKSILSDSVGDVASILVADYYYNLDRA